MIRNIAIIAHVDHGKTSLVDAMLRYSLRSQHLELAEQALDSNDLERERGITILAKNTAITYAGVKINIVDTPGHADFGGEVERVLKMVDAVLLLVDAIDGPMPQTRFVLAKALAMDLKPIVVINKIDRPFARPEEVLDQVLDLFIELDASDEQIEFPVVYTSAKMGLAFDEVPSLPLDESLYKESSIDLLLEKIIDEIDPPSGDSSGPLQILISNVDYDSYLGRLAIGRIERGSLKANQPVVVTATDAKTNFASKIAKVFVFDALSKKEVDSASCGDIVCLAGIAEVKIGQTICDPSQVEALDFVKIEEPTIAMTFAVNDSPFAGTEGKFVTSRQLRERLFRELRSNVALQVEEADSTERFIVKGRGELHLSILIETMRREGYEFQVSKPEVIYKEIDGILSEPEEFVVIDVPEEYLGVVIEGMGQRKAVLVEMLPPEKSYIRLHYKISSRALIGYRSKFLTETRGNGIITSIISGYKPYEDWEFARSHGVLIAHETGTALNYGLHRAEERGELFIGPGERVYAGMIVGKTNNTLDVTVNCCRKKQATNIRASGSDESLKLVTATRMTLEQSLDFVEKDEWIELTPQSIRLRKKILDHNLRLRAERKD